MITSFFNTIAFRLTVWFAGIFTICSAVAFLLFYYLATQTIQEQIDIELMENASKFSTIIKRNGLMGASQLAILEAQAAGEKSIFIRLIYPSGEVFASSHMSYWKDISVNQEAIIDLMTKNLNRYETIILPATGQKARLLYTYVAQDVILQTGLVMSFADQFLSAFKKVYISAMGFIIVFSAFSGWLLIRKTLANVSVITKTAQNISAGNLDDRVIGSGRKDELDLLVTTFNSMLDRIEALVKSIGEMSDNIAHDLKSPIARIRGFAELSLTQNETMDNYRAMAANTIEESDRLIDMINTMLLISKAQAGAGDFEFENIDISKIIQNACDLYLPLAEDKKIEFNMSIQEKIVIEADRKMFQRVLSNLLDNAIKFTPENGKIHVIAQTYQDQLIIKIKDTGPGIDPILHEKIFERFYRAESSRTSTGTGLGLSLVRTIIHQHKGSVSVSDYKGSGSVFIVRLPYRHLGIISSSY
ncbi:MAG: ATP-binding protein [Pseudomonadota bacterium]